MDERSFPLALQAEEALNRLHRAGFEAWLVGGCVRDFLLGRQPTDYDLTTNARPEETEEVFRGEQVVETGLRHGTVTVLLEGLPLEITTYRVDEGYSDGRHPDGVRFTASLREDAARRDFTINAMAYTREAGVQDFFGGREDLQKRQIRCVGDPDRRFREDALRMLRAARFAAVLGFSIEPDTAAAMQRNRALLGRVSRERVEGELGKLLCGKEAGGILLSCVELLGQVLPELLPMEGFAQRNPHHCYDVLAHTAAALDQTPPQPVLRWAVLLHDVGKPRCFSLDEAGVGHFYGHARESAVMAEEILRRLRLDNDTRARVVTLVRWHDAPLEEDPRLLRRWLHRLGPEALLQLVEVQRADLLALAPEERVRAQRCQVLRRKIEELLAEETCFTLRDLTVKGNDLMALGYRGRQIGTLLQTLLEQVMDGKVPNEKERLLQLAKDNFAKKPDNLEE